MTVKRTIFVTLVLVCSGFARGDMSANQIETGAITAWSDLETWSRPHLTTGDADTGLGLHLSGPNGPMLLAFSARVGDADSKDITVQVAAGATVDSNVPRTATLRFVLNGHNARRGTIDLSPHLKVDNPSLDAAVASGVAPMPATELLLIARAETITATVLGVEVQFRPDQIQAVDAFARRILFGPEN